MNSSMIHLRGMAWDHRRCWGPLDASVAPYRAIEPQVAVSWRRRSLYSFGEGRLDTLLEDCDLVILDHPFVGEIAAHGWFHDVRGLLPDDDLDLLAADTLGACWRSYQAEGGQWAMPIDAAAQVAAYRPDLLARSGHAVPATFDEVLALAEALRSEGLAIAVPAIPTDLMCLFITIAASQGQEVGQGAFLDPHAGEVVIGAMRRLLAAAHPASVAWNPIRCYDHMAATDEVAYVPYAFGYVNYADPTARRVIRFADAPAMKPGQAARAILGGAGIAVSARSPHPEAAARYALHLCRPDHQATDYVRNGGQPASRSAWLDAGANARASNFFADTLRTLEAAYLRPTVPGFVGFFQDAGVGLAECLRGDTSQKAWLTTTNDRYVRLADQRRGIAAIV